MCVRFSLFAYHCIYIIFDFDGVFHQNCIWFHNNIFYYSIKSIWVFTLNIIAYFYPSIKVILKFIVCFCCVQFSAFLLSCLFKILPDNILTSVRNLSQFVVDYQYFPSMCMFLEAIIYVRRVWRYQRVIRIRNSK